jgi:N-formylmaleamate deformylase
MGAITAATLAANYPGLVRAVVLEDPPLRFTEADHGGASREQAAAVRRRSLPDFPTTLPQEPLTTPATMNPGWQAGELAAWSESKAQFDPGRAGNPLSTLPA